MRALRVARNAFLALLALALVALAALYLYTQSLLKVEPFGPTTKLLPGHVAEGARLATVIGCRGCHRDDLTGGTFLAQPYIFRLVAPNLTQVRDKYDDAAWLRLFRSGAKRDGQLAVGMPVASLQRLTEQEVADIVAYVRSVPRAGNQDLGSTHLYPLARIGLLTGRFKLEDLQGDAPESPTVLAQRNSRDRGEHLAYITCNECHGHTLDGGGNAGGPPLVVAKGYTPDTFARLLRTGITAAGTESASGLMSEVGRGRFSALTDAEVDELYRYLQRR